MLLWSTPILARAQKKALLRCLLDKVVIHRVGRDRVHLRLVWRGGEVTIYDIPITVGSLAELSSGQELEARVLQLHAAGKSDHEIAQELTAAGFTSIRRAQMGDSPDPRFKEVESDYRWKDCLGVDCKRP